MTKIVFILVMTAVSSVAFGQGHHPYAGLEQRAVKALSEQQIADLRAGRGMGLALPAELNGYPRPFARLGECGRSWSKCRAEGMHERPLRGHEGGSRARGRAIDRTGSETRPPVCRSRDHSFDSWRGNGRDWNDTSPPSPNSLEIPFGDDGRAVARPSRTLPRTKGLRDEGRSIASPALTALMSR